jgi:hypothetical protein
VDFGPARLEAKGRFRRKTRLYRDASLCANLLHRLSVTLFDVRPVNPFRRSKSARDAGRTRLMRYDVGLSVALGLALIFATRFNLKLLTLRGQPQAMAPAAQLHGQRETSLL